MGWMSRAKSTLCAGSVLGGSVLFCAAARARAAIRVAVGIEMRLVIEEQMAPTLSDDKWKRFQNYIANTSRSQPPLWPRWEEIAALAALRMTVLWTAVCLESTRLIESTPGRKFHGS